MARKRRKHYDLREYWPWFERWYSGLDRAEPPPFSLNDIRSDQPPIRGQKWLQLLCIIVAVGVLVGIVWGIFFA